MFVLEASESVQKHLATLPDTVSTTALLLGVGMLNYKRVALEGYCDNLSLHMRPFVDQIQALSKLPGGLEPSLNLLFRLGFCSYEEHTSPRGNRGRPSDQPADQLMVEVLLALRAQDPAFMPRNDYHAWLKWEVEKLAEWGPIDTYFPLSLELMDMWEAEARGN